ncbi:MAG: DUF1289 domain-containing protein [Fimbriimonadaceae bacterium]|nr:DUF1289 domain-containing protein [Fimbriimonadaceae bacterium]QYK58616.1 MAG: DUF1289 domain-containing protein [Fimbriimonadaceae bacterium]
MDPPPVSSPCTRVCRLNEEQMCIGCGRHIEEICDWPFISEAERAEICRQAAERIAALNQVS